MAFLAILKPSAPLHLVMLFLVIGIGTICSHHAERLLDENDSRHIVIDEFAGYLLSMIFLPPTIAYLVAGFLLFRFFDILKPLPIRKIEKIFPGGLGIMADDLLAGIYTNLVLQAWRLLT